MRQALNTDFRPSLRSCPAVRPAQTKPDSPGLSLTFARAAHLRGFSVLEVALGSPTPYQNNSGLREDVAHFYSAVGHSAKANPSRCRPQHREAIGALARPR